MASRQRQSTSDSTASIAGPARLLAAAAGICAIAVAGMGCVDTEPALKLKGFTAYPATIEQQELTCNPEAGSGDGGGGGGGGGMGPETYTVTYNRASCDTEVDPADIETFQYEAGLNINEFRQFGQPGFGTDNQIANLRTRVCQDQKPSNAQIEQETSEWFSAFSGSANFTISVNVINNLEDNRNTGAQGGAGGGQGGGFEGIYADGNDVKLQQIEIRFPNAGQFNDEIPVAAVVDSQGGAVNIPAVRMFSSNQIGRLETLHKDLVTSRTGVSPSEYDANSGPKETEVILEAEVRAIGETLSGKMVTSNEVTLPIRICRTGTACVTTGSCGYTL